MLIDLLMCKCEEESCEHEFITNSYEDLSCPSCGSENVFGIWKKASVFESFKFSDVNSEKELQAKINKEVSKINDMVKNYNTAKDYNLNQGLYVFKKEEGKENLRKILFECCDNDFNGNNGEEYYTTINIDGEDIPISKFELWWLKSKHKDEKIIIQNILDANYLDDDYYHNYDLQIIDREDEVVFSYAVTY